MKMEASGVGRWVRLSLVVALLASSLAPTAFAQGTQATSLQLPDGSQCQFVGNDTSPNFNGQRVNYNCGSAPDNGTNVVLGTPSLQNGVWTVTQGVIEPAATGPSLRSSQTLTLDISRVTLVDNSTCDATSSSSTETIQNQRINYTCGSPQVALVGDFNTSANLWTATRVRLSGTSGSFVVTGQDTAGIGSAVFVTHSGGPTPSQATSIQLPDGSVCLFAGTGATAVFNGQRVNYTCGNAPNNGTTVILGSPTFQSGQLLVTEGITDAGSNGPTLRSSQNLTLSLTQVNLTDNTVCKPAAASDVVTINGQTMNYTCGRSIEGLIGDFNTTNPLWTIDKVILQQNTSTPTVQSRVTDEVAGVITQTATPAVQATSITLPDGSVCQFSGTGATLTFNGQRVNYMCGVTPSGATSVILGTPTTQNGTWVVQQGVIAPQSGGGFTLQSSQTINMTIARVDLVDGTSCAFSGTGATIAINGQRLNYTCSTGTPNVALVGDFNTSQPLWTANRVNWTGTPAAVTVTGQDTVGIKNAVGQSTTGPSPSPQPTPQPTPGPAPNAPPQTRDGRFFAETNFRVGNDAFWNFFQSRGAIDTFGFPVSRQFGFLGCQVQIFQRSIMQQCGDNAAVALLNLLDPDLFPYTMVNGSTFPPADDAIKARTPIPGSPGYDQAIIQFVNDTAPNTFEGLPVAFGETFNDTGGLEIWGAPISNPAYDPANHQFVYQRFQRGIMHFAVGQGTRGILLADFLKSIMLGPTLASQYGANLPADLQAQAQGSNKYSQYCPGQAGWLCRPADLPGTDLTYAFESG